MVDSKDVELYPTEEVGRIEWRLVIHTNIRLSIVVLT